MTELIIGSAGSGKGERIVDAIRSRLGNGRKKYLIVPEQQAVLWEARACRSLPASAALELEIVNFKRLADTVFRSVGGLYRVYTGEAKRILTMWRALGAVKDSLKVYKAAEGHEEKYISLFLDVARELATHSVGIDRLDEASERTEGALSDKLSDLSLVLSAYRAMSEESESADPDRVLDSLAKTLRTSEFFKGCDVFIDSFYSFTPVENEILYYIMRDAEDIVITFTLGEGPHFDHVRKFYRTVLRLAAACSREVTKVTLGENRRTDRRDILYLEKNLWNFTAPKNPEPDGAVSVIRCRDRYEEARAVGARIERLVHEGASYSDIAVVARDIENYRGIIDTRLDALEIPYYLSKRNSVAASPVLTFIVALLEAVHDGCRLESVVKCLKTGVFPLSTREVSCFESYAETWNIRGARAYLRETDWEMNPAGYRAELSERGAAVRTDANEVRRAFAKPLSELSPLFGGKTAKVVDICKTLYGIMEALDVFSRVADEGDEEAVKSSSAVVDALSALACTVPDEEVSASSASRLIYAVASSFDVGSIPCGVDVVTLGSASGLRIENVKHVILVGCAEGEFPASVEDHGFFSNAEAERLGSLGIELSDGEEAERNEELFRFWRCVTMPSESVTVTYPASGDDGARAPSIGTRQVIRLTGCEVRDYAEMPIADSVWSERGASDAALSGDASVASALDALGMGKRSLSSALSADEDSVGEDFAKSLTKQRLALTQSRIDKFSECPFSYYMRYVLKLDEPRSAEVGAVDVGNLVHRVLELFFKRTAMREFPIPEAESEALVDEIIGEYLSEIMRGAEATSRQRYLFARLRRNVLVLVRSLMDEFSKTEFRPYRFELPMSGGEESPAPLEFVSSAGTKVTLYGTIDRVDVFGDGAREFVRVVDYKTFGKTFKMSDVQKGMNLQLLIYLFTLWKGGESRFREELSRGREIMPAGMIYLSSSPDSASSDVPVTPDEALALASGTVGRSGVLLDDPLSLRAMGAGEKGLYSDRRCSVLSLDELEDLYGEVEKVIVQISNSIQSGDCASRPAGTPSALPCRYCKMKPVCRHIEGEVECDE